MSKLIRSLFVLSLGLAPTAVAQDAIDHHRQALPNGVATGDVDRHGVVLWARAQRPGVLIFQVSDRADFRGRARSELAVVRDPSVPAKVEVDHLVAGRTYFVRVLGGGRELGRATFRTAAPANTRRGLRFGVSGDQRGELAPFVAVRNVPQRDLDFFVALGDTIYADYPSPKLPIRQASTLAEFRIKNEDVYAERFMRNHLADLRASTAWFATIDDHEVTNDFAGGAHPSTDPRFAFTTEQHINETVLYGNGLRAFTEYQPQAALRYGATADPRTAHKPKLYRTRRFGADAQMFLLDARSFRDAGLPPVTDPRDPVQVAQFLAASFNPGRTMLGAAQIAELERDLQAAEVDGVTWKFVFVPEPIQNLGVVAASDRFEGYAAERTRLLRFIDQQRIRNVVFVAADLHGTLVNNLTYQLSPIGAQIPTGAFEVITGAVAFDAPLGPTLVDLATQLGLITPQQRALYESLPRVGKDGFVQNLVDGFLVTLGYDLLGLQGSPVQAQLVSGSYTNTHTFGWTEFVIEPESQVLRVRTWGIDPYTEADLGNPAAVLARQPALLAEFTAVPR